MPPQEETSMTLRSLPRDPAILLTALAIAALAAPAAAQPADPSIGSLMHGCPVGVMEDWVGQF
jgi:hypothetical protein